MAIFFELFKSIFLVVSVIVALFTLRGYYYIPDATFTALNNIIMPGYLLLVGLIMGYMYILYLKTQKGDELTHKDRVTGFTVGLLGGVSLAIIYIFVR